jgi:APA family basic amino acid/polyamine antiporter
MLALIALYLGMTLIYHMVLPLDEIGAASFEKGSPRIVAADFFAHLLGPWGLRIIALVVMTSTFISLNGNALSGPRAYFAMARDGVFPKGLCTIHPRHRTPANAIIAQTLWAVILMVTTTAFRLIEPPKAGLPEMVLEIWAKLHVKPLYDILFTYVIFGGTIFYGLSIVSVFVLRSTQPDLPRPYRTWGYPFTPLLYTAASLLLLGSMLSESPGESIAGLAIVAAGVPAYLVFSRKSASIPPAA